ncbi:hypothetical protein TNCV_4042851 [Trichonephila clavipes]|nr:hypothetical protein TNCV_4042851 [Trichonephila clavipes]
MSNDMLDRSKEMLDRSKEMLDWSNEKLDRSNEMLDRSNEIFGALSNSSTKEKRFPSKIKGTVCEAAGVLGVQIRTT